MKRDNLEKFTVKRSSSIRKAVGIMDKNGKGVVFVLNEDKTIAGVVTDGDFRRAVLRGIGLDEPVDTIMTEDFLYLKRNFTKKELKNIFKKRGIKHIPVIEGGKLYGIIFKEEYAETLKIEFEEKKLNVPAVIMAGGKGTRLDPFTRILPKPLIPIGKKPVIEIIIENLSKIGVEEFYISVFHMKNILKIYIEENLPEYRINLVEEDKPLGTIGALYFLKNKIKTDFITTNCDVIVNTDYEAIINFHRENKNMITIIGSMINYTIPYGVCEVDEKGNLEGFNEKPKFDFLVNTGVYVFSSKIFKYFRKAKRMDFPELLFTVKENNEKVGVFPVSENSWIDVGEWEKYKESFRLLNEYGS